MITIAAVLSRLPALDEGQLRVWIEAEWVRPVRSGGEPLFAEIDLARLRLILDLQALEIGPAAMPVVLSLLDQLHQSRRQTRRMLNALDEAGLSHLRRTLIE